MLLLGCSSSTPAPTFTAIDFASAADMLHDTSGELIDESWFVHRIGTAKIGYRWSRTYRVRDAVDSDLRRLVIDQLEMPRFRGIARQTLRMAERSNAGGVVHQLAYELDSGGRSRLVAAVVNGNELHLQSKTPNAAGKDESQTTRLPWSASIGGFQAIEQSLLRNPLQTGETRTVSMLQPINDTVQPYVLSRDAVEGMPLLSPSPLLHVAPSSVPADHNLIRVLATPKTTGTAAETLTFWVDKNGRIQRRDSSFLEQSMVRATELAAMAPSDMVDFDVALHASVRLDKPISNPESVRTARYRIHWTGDPPQLAECGYQRVVAESDDTAIIVVTEQEGEGATETGREGESGILERQLHPATKYPTSLDVSPNRWLEVTHPAIQSLANAAAGNETDPRKVAYAIREHVYRWLDKSEADQVLATARQAAEGRQGDCTEHAMLTASACRARNIPARVAVGLIYDEASQSMVYHMWTEIWLDDTWQPLDATRPHADFNATRIKLEDNNLSAASDIGIVLPVFRVAGRISIEVLDTR